ncbi:hypothetical protein KY289_000349 [Solanum tuberosum]|nr:hypothetical protein KY289_000349 [Solanum tuberosum]
MESCLVVVVRASCSLPKMAFSGCFGVVELLFEDWFVVRARRGKWVVMGGCELVVGLFWWCSGGFGVDLV